MFTENRPEYTSRWTRWTWAGKICWGSARPCIQSNVSSINRTKEAVNKRCWGPVQWKYGTVHAGKWIHIWGTIHKGYSQLEKGMRWARTEWAATVSLQLWSPQLSPWWPYAMAHGVLWLQPPRSEQVCTYVYNLVISSICTLSVTYWQ